jgi:hypothetical protein
VNDVLEKIEKAMGHVFELCDGTAKWTMRVPVDEDRDSDCIIINNRYENLKTTIFTSNSDLNALAHQLGDDRIPSRIVEMCQIKHFTNKDYRIGG